MAKQLMYGELARRKMSLGAAQLTGATRVTFGPSGKNVIIEKKWGGPLTTKDGATVIKEIELEDPFEHMGAKLISEAASKTNDAVGDGTTTTTILAEAIFNEGLKYLATGVNAAEMKRGIEIAVKAVISEIGALSKPVKTQTELLHVATISAHNDAEIGKIVAETLEKVTKDGVVTVEEGKGMKTTVEYVEGLRFDKGFISPYFITDLANMRCVLEDAYVLLHEKKISNARELVMVLERVVPTGKGLLIVAEDIEGEALATLVINKLRGVLKVCAVKAPAFGDRRKAILQDIAIITGGQVISEDIGLNLERTTLDKLGQTEKVVVDKENTTIIGGHGSNTAIKQRIQQIKAQIEKSTSDYDREKLTERLAKLVGGVAIIKVGAPSETEMKEKKERVEDALNSARAAREEGIIPGGGVAYIRAIPKLSQLRVRGDEKLGVRIIEKALEMPLRQIAENAGYDGSTTVEEVKARGKYFGFDALTGKIVDMMKAGIVDPAKVSRIALQNAASLASMMLMSETMVTDIKEKEEKGKKIAIPVDGSIR